MPGDFETFGEIPIECGYGDPYCTSGFQWGGHELPANLFPPPFQTFTGGNGPGPAGGPSGNDPMQAGATTGGTTGTGGTGGVKPIPAIAPAPPAPLIPGIDNHTLLIGVLAAAGLLIVTRR
jgi:hypothetical protein